MWAIVSFDLHWGSTVREVFGGLMKARFLYAAVTTVAMVAVLGLQVWLTGTGHVPPVLALGSFGAMCLLLSFVPLPSAAQAETGKISSIAGVKRPGRAEVISISQARTPAFSAARPIINAFTIDLEDYFHTEVASAGVPYSAWDAMPPRLHITVPRLLDTMDRHKVRSTVFVLGWVARKYPWLVKEIAYRGHEVACHSDRHRPVFKLSPAEFEADTIAAKNTLEDLTGERVRGYRAPSFSITPGTEWAFDILRDAGFDYDSSVNPVRHKFYGNPNAPRFSSHVGKNGLLEIPVATWRVGSHNLPVSGGAYLRLLPYNLMKAGLKHINAQEQQPFTVYMHPWEIDAQVTPLQLSGLSRIRQGHGTATMEAKLERLFKDFRFAPMAEVYANSLAGANPEMSPEKVAAAASARLGYVREFA
jgi:polysaccharide deacetylase family protein (PEP-CTERM system associated)